jgi:LVIVD repeat
MLYKRIWAATGIVASLVLAARWVYAARTERPLAFHVVGHLKLPPTPIRNDYHHLHVSETDTERFLTVTDSNNVMTIVDVSDGTNPTLARQVRLPAVVAHGDPVALMGGVALVTEETGKSSASSDPSGAKTVSIVNMNHYPNCNVTGRFENVTGMEVDSTQSHIYLISDDELWILGGRQHWHASFSK